MRTIYNILLLLILPFLPIRLFWRSLKNKNYRARIGERFGYFNFVPLENSIWVHAVSVGEAIAAIPLIKALIEKYSSTKIVVTTMTPTGAERVKNAFQEKVIQVYVPYDYPFVVTRFLNHMKPKILILMETELWPNILHHSAQKNIPVILANARLSAKSFSGYKRIRFFVQEMLNHITTVAAQSKIDAERFLALGLAAEKLLIAGNVKFDMEVQKKDVADAEDLRLFFGKNRPVLVAGSTHHGEEEKILIALKKVQEVFPEILLILVPRHPERFDDVFSLCCKHGFDVVRYSEKQKYSTATNVVLGDVMGKLMLFYAAGDVAFVGGSLISWGGHNLLEPAALAKPVISGPNMSAFSEISQLMIDHDALIVVKDESELSQQVIKLCDDKILREKFGVAALDVVEAHRGATKKILKLISDNYASK